MAATYAAKVLLDLAFTEVISSGMKAGPVTSRLLEQLDLVNGTNDGQIDRAYAKTETGIGSAVTTTYDLTGSLTGLDGTPINFAEVVLVAVRNKSATAANWLSVGPNASTGFGVVTSNKGFWADVSDRNVVPADGDSWMVLYSKAGVPVSGGSTDLLAIITQSGTSANTWDLFILGRSA